MSCHAVRLAKCLKGNCEMGCNLILVKWTDSAQPIRKSAMRYLTSWWPVQPIWAVLPQ